MLASQRLGPGGLLSGRTLGRAAPARASMHSSAGLIVARAHATPQYQQHHSRIVRPHPHRAQPARRRGLPHNRASSEKSTSMMLDIGRALEELGFVERDGDGAMLATEDARKKNLQRWREKKRSKSRDRLLTNLLVTAGVALTCFTLHAPLAGTIQSSLQVNTNAPPAMSSAFMTATSLLFSLLFGQTLAILDARRREVSICWTNEILALEQSTLFVIHQYGPAGIEVLGLLQDYCREELLEWSNLEPPYDENQPLHSIQMWIWQQQRLEREKGAGRDGKGDGPGHPTLDLATLQRHVDEIGRHQNARLAEGATELPPTHWAYIIFLAICFLTAFMLFERPFELNAVGKSTIFGLSSGLVTAALLTLTDMADPNAGLYSAWFELNPRVQKLKLVISRAVNKLQEELEEETVRFQDEMRAAAEQRRAEQVCENELDDGCDFLSLDLDPESLEDGEAQNGRDAGGKASVNGLGVQDAVTVLATGPPAAGPGKRSRANGKANV